MITFIIAAAVMGIMLRVKSIVDVVKSLRKFVLM